MKPIIVSISIVSGLMLVSLLWAVQQGYVGPHSIHISLMPRLSSRRYQVVTGHIQDLMSRGEEARRVGDLKTAKIEFKAVIADQSDFPSKQCYVTKAKAELAKIYEQRNHQGILRVPLSKWHYRLLCG